MNSFDKTAEKWANSAVRNIIKGRKKCSKCDGSGSIGYDHDGLWVDALECDNCFGHGDIPTNDWLDDLLRRPKLKRNEDEKKISREDSKELNVWDT